MSTLLPNIRRVIALIIRAPGHSKLLLIGPCLVAGLLVPSCNLSGIAPVEPTAEPTEVPSVDPIGPRDPESLVTRAELVVVILQGLKGDDYEPFQTSVTRFTDISGHWAESWIERLAADGLVSGHPDGSFKPDMPVTRAELAVFLLKAKHGADYLPPAVLGGIFADIEGHWAQAWIEQLALEGIAQGEIDGTYRPGENVRWGELEEMEQAVFNSE
jgi:hypothetical protein